MLERIRTIVLAGLGAGVITKEKAEAITNRLVEQGKLTADEGKQLLNDLLKSGGQQWKDVQAGVTNAVRKALNSANVARANDLEEIGRGQEKLEQRMAMLEDALERIRASDTSTPDDSESDQGASDEA